MSRVPPSISSTYGGDKRALDALAWVELDSDEQIEVISHLNPQVCIKATLNPHLSDSTWNGLRLRPEREIQIAIARSKSTPLLVLADMLEHADKEIAYLAKKNFDLR